MPSSLSSSDQLSPLLFHGTLLTNHGNSIPSARIQLWQTDLNGNYLHPNPNAADPSRVVSTDDNEDRDRAAAIVANFQYYGTATTDSKGHFEFLTYRPGIYPNRPYSHFHFKVWTDSSSSKVVEVPPALITQFYFRDENPPFFDIDNLLLDVMEVDERLSGGGGGGPAEGRSSSAYAYKRYVNGTIVIADADADSGNRDGESLLPLSPPQPEGPFYPEINFFDWDNDLTSKDGSDAEERSVAPVNEPTKEPILHVSTEALDELSVPSTSDPTNEPTKEPIDEPTENPIGNRSTPGSLSMPMAPTPVESGSVNSTIDTQMLLGPASEPPPTPHSASSTTFSICYVHGLFICFLLLMLTSHGMEIF